MKSLPQARHGAMLVVVMSLLAITAVFVGVALNASSQQTRTARQGIDLTRTQAASDAAFEYSYAAWKALIRANGLRPPTNAEITAASLPPPTSGLHPAFAAAGISFSDFSVVNANQWGETIDGVGAPITDPIMANVPNVPGHPGWSGSASYYRAAVTASIPSLRGPVTTSAVRCFQVTGVPIFQAAIFFDYDIELHPGPPMTITGLVHTNSDLWVATANPGTLQFKSNVSYVGTYHEAYKSGLTYGGGSTSATTPNPALWSDGLPSSTSTAYPTQGSQVERLEPYGSEPGTLFDTGDTNTNNDGMREIIERPNTADTDPPEIAAMRLYNQAAVRITIDRSLPVTDPGRVLITNASNGSLPAATDSAIRAALNVSTTPIYDWREGENVYVTNVNMAALDTALAGMGAGFNGVLYVEDVTSSDKNAIRLQNGSVISNDLTVASSNGVYIQGDFNTGGVDGSGVHDPLLVASNNGGNATGTDSPVAAGYTKKSCAIAADAVMILSNNWNDANSTLSLSSRVATHTTVNAAIVGGIVPSNYQGSGVYSGGPHNFPRFLEKWSGVDLTYWGSMVQLYFSEQFDGIFDTGNIYSPPGRRWNYDSQLATRPPPGLFRNLQYSRGRWQRL